MSSAERLSSSSVGPFDPMPDLITPSETSSASLPRGGGGAGAAGSLALPGPGVGGPNGRGGAATAAAATAAAVAGHATSLLGAAAAESTRTEGVKNGELGTNSHYNGAGGDHYRSEHEAEMSVLTETHLETHKINWRIDSRTLHIATLAPKGDKRGVIEANLVKKGHRFKLELCASGWRNSQDNYAAFYLTVADEGDLFVARYRVRVGEIQRISSIRHDFHLGVGFPNFCLQPALSDLMDNDQVNFYVTVEVFSCSSDVKSPPRPPRLPVSQRSDEVLSRLVRYLFKHREHSDVTLQCSGGKRIRAHKALLAAASPVFRSMFSHQMVESMTNTVSMSSWSVNCVRLMVYFIYHGELPGNHAILLDQQNQQQNQQQHQNNNNHHHHHPHHHLNGQSHDESTQLHSLLVPSAMTDRGFHSRMHRHCQSSHSNWVTAATADHSATKLLRSADCLTSPSPDTLSSSSCLSSLSAGLVAASCSQGRSPLALVAPGLISASPLSSSVTGPLASSAEMNGGGSSSGSESSGHRVMNDCSLITGLDEDDDEDDDDEDLISRRPYSIRSSAEIANNQGLSSMSGGISSSSGGGSGSGNSSGNSSSSSAGSSCSSGSSTETRSMSGDDSLMMVDQTVQADLDQLLHPHAHHHHHHHSQQTAASMLHLSSEEDLSSFADTSTTDEDISMESCKKHRARSVPANSSSLVTTIESSATVSVTCSSTNAASSSACPSSSSAGVMAGSSSSDMSSSLTSLSKSQSPLHLRMADGTRRVIRGNRHRQPAAVAAAASTMSCKSTNTGAGLLNAMDEAGSAPTMRKPTLSMLSSDQSMVLAGGSAGSSSSLHSGGSRSSCASSSCVSAAGMSSAGIYFDVFALAEYYEIEPLVIACCERMFNNLTVNSACDLLIKIQIFSHVRSVAQIEESVWSFVTDHIHQVKRTEGYARMLRNHPALLERLIDRIT